MDGELRKAAGDVRKAHLRLRAVVLLAQSEGWSIGRIASTIKMDRNYVEQLASQRKQGWW